MSATVVIHYRRPPDREQRFEQRVVHRTDRAIITFLPRTPLPAPVRIGGRIVLEDGAPAVWFTFPGAWHDIGRFHRADGRFTGVYANILTPVRFLDERTWETTDLFLDLWLPPDGAVRVLDRAEFENARAHGWVDERTAARALGEALRLRTAAAHGAWPPRVVDRWPLDRVRAAEKDPRTTDESAGGEI